jgi:hypothetical protein
MMTPEEEVTKWQKKYEESKERNLKYLAREQQVHLEQEEEINEYQKEVAYFKDLAAKYKTLLLKKFNETSGIADEMTWGQIDDRNEFAAQLREIGIDPYQETKDV